jgi:hypothetical protein
MAETQDFLCRRLNLLQLPLLPQLPQTRGKSLLAEVLFLNFSGAQESIPRNRFRQLT